MTEKKKAKIASRSKKTVKTEEVKRLCENGCLKMDQVCTVFGQMLGIYQRAGRCPHFTNTKLTI